MLAARHTHATKTNEGRASPTFVEFVLDLGGLGDLDDGVELGGRLGADLHVMPGVGGRHLTESDLITEKKVQSVSMHSLLTY